MREVRALAKETERQEIEGAEQRIEQQREQERYETAARAEQERVAREQAEAQRQHAHRQQAERARVAALEWQAQASNKERQLVDEWRNLGYQFDQWARATPELANPYTMQLAQQTNPARWAEIQQQIAQAQQAKQNLETQFNELQETRQAKAHAIATHQQQAYQQWRAAESTKAAEWISNEVPSYRTPEGKAKLTAAVRAELKDVGVSDQEIAQWRNGQPIDINTVAGQRLLARLGERRLAREHYEQYMRDYRAKELAKEWPVHTPGTHRPRGAGAVEDIRSLQRQLDSAKGDKAVRIAAKLTRARRDAGYA
jgi:hypothetical protein